MSPNERTTGQKIIARDNLYTVLLVAAVGLVMIAAVFVAYKCYCQYGTIFKIP